MRNGIDQEAHARKRKEIVDAHIEVHMKKITAELLASTQKFALGPNIFAATLGRKRILDIVISAKKRQQGRVLAKVLTLEEQKRTKERISVAKLKLIVRWYN